MAARPPGLTPALDSMWHERRGRWMRAHEIAQDDPGLDATWVHAYLHRRKGDRANAAGWYRRVGRPSPAPASMSSSRES